MSQWKRIALIAGALPFAAVAQDSFPARTSGNAGTTIAVEAGGDAERLFQAEKERERVKAEAERVAREAAERKAAEEARIERERAEMERLATEEAERAAANKAAAEQAAAETAAAAEQAAALQARIDGAATAPALFVLADELKSKGDIEGSRAALRALIARFPEHKFADMAVTMLTGQPLPGAAAASESAAKPAPAPPANACLAVLSQFSAMRPQSPGGTSTIEREVFYSQYYERLLYAAPACRGDPVTSQQIRDSIKRNTIACQQQPGLNCVTGVPDTAIANVEAVYERVVAQARAPAPAQTPIVEPGQ